MMKNKKTLIFILVFVLTICTLSTTVFSKVIDVNKYNPKIDNPLDNTSKTIIGKLVGFITNVGSVVAVFALVIIGIRFMVGSVEEKAQYKESLKPYLVGAFLVFGILQVVDALYNVGMDLVL